jgi:ribosomal protein S18 acetylase RimI-like enzyme
LERALSEPSFSGIPKHQYVIRLALGSDLAAVQALDSECFPEGSLDLQPAAEGELEDGILQGSTFVAENSGRVVGMIQFDRADPANWELLALAITQSFRGTGLGKLLMEKLSSEIGASKRPVSVTCVTSPNNIPMQQLLERFAFTKSQLLIDYFGPNKHRLRYELKASMESEA